MYYINMSITSLEYTRQLLASLPATESDLPVNRQGMLSTSQQARMQKRAKTTVIACLFTILCMLALSAWLWTLLPSGDRTFTLVFAIVTTAVFALIMADAWPDMGDLRQARVTSREGRAEVAIYAGYRRHGRHMHTRVTIEGALVRLPRETVLLMVSGLRYRVYLYHGRPVSIEALDDVTLAQVQSGAQTYTEKRLGHLQYVLILFAIMLIPILLDFFLNDVLLNY